MRRTTLTTAALLGVVVLLVLLAGCERATPVAEPPGPAVDVHTLTVRAADFVYHGTPTVASATYDVPKLTQAVIERGGVTSYWDADVDDDKWWWQLPNIVHFRGRQRGGSEAALRSRIGGRASDRDGCGDRPNNGKLP